MDGFDLDSNTAYEFYGDYFRGHPAVIHPDSQRANMLYEKTKERYILLSPFGVKVESMWESEWLRNMGDFSVDDKGNIHEYLDKTQVL